MKRTHALLYLSSFTEGIAMTLIMFLVPLNMRTALGEQRFFVIASSVAIPAISAFVSSNFWGGLSDLKGKLKPFLVIGLVGYAICLGLLGLVHNSKAVLIVVALAPVIYGALKPASQSYITLSRDTEKGKAIGDLLSFQSFGWLLGSSVCWRLYKIGQSTNADTLFFGGAAVALVSAIVIALFLEDMKVPRDRSHHSSIAASVRADLAELYNSRKILIVCAVTFLVQISNFAFFSLYSMYFTEYIRGPQNILWLSVGASTVFGIIFYSVAGRVVDSIGGRKSLFLAVALYLISYTLMGSTRNPLLLALYFSIPVYPFLNVSNTTMIAELAGKGQRTGGMGILNGTFSFSVAAGSILGGIVADGAGLAFLPVVAIGGMLVTLFFTYYMVMTPVWNRAK